MKAGVRVVRGPDWNRGDDDGGEGHVGTLVELDGDEEWATVVWDSGAKKKYRAGRQGGAFDLHVFDNGQIDVRHDAICDSCTESGIIGIRWKCSVCDDYDLCTECYMRDRHSTSHAFVRIDNPRSAPERVPRRCDSQAEIRKSKGIFPGAIVCRGPDWIWGNQDGAVVITGLDLLLGNLDALIAGKDRLGLVLHIADWEPSFRSKVGVLWRDGSSYNYRVGHDGKLDVRHVRPGAGWPYYKNHLPILGKMTGERPRGPFGTNTLLQALLQEQVMRPFETLMAMKLLRASQRAKSEAAQPSTPTRRPPPPPPRETPPRPQQPPPPPSPRAAQPRRQPPPPPTTAAPKRREPPAPPTARSPAPPPPPPAATTKPQTHPPPAQQHPHTSAPAAARKPNVVEVKVGCRVVRGPDWAYDNEDDGEGHVGTVVDTWGPGHLKPPDKCVVVLWDSGRRSTCRVGKNEAYDLLVYDSGPSGVRHLVSSCNECKSEVIRGTRWKCVVCFDYDLCSACYHSDEHNTLHEFWRINNETSKRVRVPRREGSEMVKAMGIFIGATVRRGEDWMYGDMDGGEGSLGKVVAIKDWDPEVSTNSQVDVRWTGGSENTYRLGHLGKVDLKSSQASVGGWYYRDHLPILGKIETSECGFHVGEKVTCGFRNEVVKILQQKSGGWNDDMEKYNTMTGTVMSIDNDDDVEVKYEDGTRWIYHQDVLAKVKVEDENPAKDPMQSDVVLKVLRTRVPRERVEKFVMKRLARGRGEYPDSETLLDAVLNVDLEPDNAPRVLADGASHEQAKSPDEVTPSGRAESSDLAEENRRLREERICKVCMDQDACMAFLPCGHLACCFYCAKPLLQCPICRCEIKDCIRTFIS